MSCKTATLWKGKPLDSYSKDELIEIIEQMGKAQLSAAVEANRRREILKGRKCNRS